MIIKCKHLHLLIGIILSLNLKSLAQEVKPTDTIHHFYKSTKDKTISFEERLDYNHRLSHALKSNKRDTLYGFTLKQYNYLYYKLKDSLRFLTSNQKYIHHLQTIKDSAALVKAFEYRAAFYRRQHSIDSAFYYYFKSYKGAERLKDSLNAGKALLNIAIIQKNVHDYKGSEISSFKALEFLESTKQLRRIASVYNNLGIIYNNLKDYESAILYHQKALNLRKQLKTNPIYTIQSLNNIGKSYKDRNDYQKAQFYFKKGLSFNDSILNRYPKTKATLLDNSAHTHFMAGNGSTILEHLEYALALRHTADDDHGCIMSYIHLAEYFQNKNIDKAIGYIEKAESIAKRTKKYRDYLSSLELMAELYSDERVTSKFKSYVHVRDSLELVDKKYAESFYRIKHELDEKDSLIAEQRSISLTRLYTILALAVILIGLSAVFYFYARKKQQKATELQLSIDELKVAKANIFNTSDAVLDKQNKVRFDAFLASKFDISKTLIEFWNYQVQGFSEAEIAQTLETVTEGAIKKRRNKLYKKLKAYDGTLGTIDKFTSVTIYNKALLEFKASL